MCVCALKPNKLILFSFFREISSKPQVIVKDKEIELISLASDTNVLAIHKLLWRAQEKMGTYLAMERCVLIIVVKQRKVGMNFFDLFSSGNFFYFVIEKCVLVTKVLTLIYYFLIYKCSSE